ncbi:MAG TPA: cation diffusion facilitator family transporter [Thermoanaerobaculia bacterium]|nr:cation diffusion facilitator family transporter [Thermoanaerobaculia bacterium]
MSGPGHRRYGRRARPRAVAKIASGPARMGMHRHRHHHPPVASLHVEGDEPARRERQHRAFALGVALNLGFVAAEAGFGWKLGSLALVADAGHNLSDVLSLLLAWGASLLSTRRPTPRRTYGLRRTTILASLVSALLLLVAIGALSWEAVQRLSSPPAVGGLGLIVVSGIGVLVNGATAFLFRADRERDLNVRGAYLHMVADAAISLGVVVAGVAILVTGWSWLDPALSLVIAAVITVGTWSLLRESVDLSLDAVPAGIDPGAVARYLLDLPEVRELHDLHIWALSTTEASLTVHLVVPAAPCDDSFLHRLANELEERFGIGHTTIQLERGDAVEPCLQARPGSV